PRAPAGCGWHGKPERQPSARLTGHHGGEHQETRTRAARTTGTRRQVAGATGPRTTNSHAGRRVGVYEHDATASSSRR
ncbi:hypothetical protein, partial [Streptomyces nanshensis]|uniref:hypothetical protein n=1 Tax=Streptomyces nanshensis TaxID=518642 RepID=UPI001C0C5709